MQRSVGVPHRKAQARARQGPRRRALAVVVVGGGPVGLLNALEAHVGGAQVRVLEKRAHYTRRIWLDLLPQRDNSTSLRRLLKLGFAACATAGPGRCARREGGEGETEGCARVCVRTRARVRVRARAGQEGEQGATWG